MTSSGSVFGRCGSSRHFGNGQALVTKHHTDTLRLSVCRLLRTAAGACSMVASSCGQPEACRQIAAYRIEADGKCFVREDVGVEACSRHAGKGIKVTCARSAQGTFYLIPSNDSARVVFPAGWSDGSGPDAGAWRRTCERAEQGYFEQGSSSCELEVDGSASVEGFDAGSSL